MLVFILHLLWRKYYYGDFLPNTYYLKATGWVYTTKLHEGIKYVSGLLPIIFSSLFAYCWMYRISDNKNEKALFVTLPFSIFLYSLYNLNVGGDSFDGARLFAPVFPIFAIAGAFLLKKLRRFRILVALFATISIFYPLNKSSLDIGLTLLRSVIHGFPSHYTFKSDPKLIPAKVRNIQSCQLIKQHAKQNNITDLSMAVYYAGIPPYFCDDFVAIDLLGKSDSYIAKTKTHIGRVGHNKYDYDYSLGKFRPTYLLSLMPSIESLSDNEYLNSPLKDFNWASLVKSKEFIEHYSAHYLRPNYKPIFIRADAYKE